MARDMARKRIVIAALAAFSVSSFAMADLSPALAQVNRPAKGPRTVLGRDHPGKVIKLSDEGFLVEIRGSGKQLVRFDEIWRVRTAFVSDEPENTSVIDYADTRLFVASPLDSLLDGLSKKAPLTKLTAPNGQVVYMVANKITDISRALPGLHNPASRAVIATRDGTQQVVEAADEAKKIVAAAHVAP